MTASSMRSTPRESVEPEARPTAVSELAAAAAGMPRVPASPARILIIDRESGARAFTLKSRLAATDLKAFWRRPDAVTS
jgi:hypothetical protein